MRNISVGGWLAILCCVYFWAVVWYLKRKRAPFIKKRSALPEYLADTRRLKGACFGDRVAADRLIQYEKSLDQRINHAEAVRRALERLEVDRGRYS